MNIYKIYVKIIVLFFFMCCNKDDIINNSTTTFNIQIKHKFKDKVIDSFSVNLIKRIWIDYRSFKDTIIKKNISDINGKCKFTINEDLNKLPSNISYTIEHEYPVTDFDSTSNNWKYDISGGKLISNDWLLYAVPNCNIYIKVNEKDRVDLQIDSIFVESPFQNASMTELPFETQFPAECSDVTSIEYYYYSKGTKSKTYNKDVFVSYSKLTSNFTFYQLEF